MLENKLYYPYMDNSNESGGIKPESKSSNNGNYELEKKLAELESANLALKEQLRLKQDEIKNLESKIEELRFLYSQSEKSLHYYDQYLKTVGDVYSVARECADGIVERAESKANDILTRLEVKVREDLEKSLHLSRKVHARLVETLSVLIGQLQITYNEVNSLSSDIESVPDLIQPVLDAKQDFLDEIREDVEKYHKHSLQIIAGAKKAEQALDGMDEKLSVKKTGSKQNVQPDILAYDNLKSDKIVKTEKIQDAGNQSLIGGTPHRRMTLLEQEKLRRKMEAESRKKPIEQPKMPEEKPEEKAEAKPEDTNMADGGDLIDKKRRASVKDLLDKYRSQNI